VDYRLLGPLEVVDDGRRVVLGGARQQALLTLLLLRRNQVVATEAIVEELWAGEQPRTAHQIVRVYVSQLRKALEPDRGDDEPRILLTHGAGYMLRTEPDEVDLDRLDALRADARRLVADGRAAEAAAVLREALALWRGPPLHDVAYESFAQHEVTRLEELRLVTLEDRFEAELAAGDDAAVVADLEPLVAANPLRERLRAQLMLALYRTGRQADALTAYADARRVFVEELGLEPAERLSELQARILRHDPALEREGQSTSPAQAAQPRRRPRTLWFGIAGASIAAVSAIALAFVLRDGSSGQPANRRVTIIIGAAQRTNPPPVVALALDGVRAAERDLHADVHVVYGGSPGALDADGIRAMLERAASRSGLVYTPDIGNNAIIARVARAFPRTRFVVGYQVERAPYSGLANVTGITFANREVGYLAGYLAALAARDGAVSVVGGVPFPVVVDLVEGFAEGAHAARPSIRVLKGYSGTFYEQSPCETLAKRQIDAGSRVVFDAAGDCGFGALEAAGIRGVWGIGVDKDLSYLGPHILASAVKRLDHAPELAIKLFLDDELPRGKTILLDLSSDSVGLVGISNRVSAPVREKLLQVAATLRKRDQQRQTGN
jgi:basic membrane lipoprotein Med (substrate-binding protein (PBP1-ABC) superfamily)/DNA-binding SARP family transcriptional activator